MANSKRARQLGRQIEELRRFLLPSVFDPLGQYKNWQKVHARTRAFLILSHAEIESFLEEWAKEIAKACEISWVSTGKINAPFAYLIATLADRIPIPDTLSRSKDSPQRMVDISVGLFQDYYKSINDNHGIRERNVHALFFPLGVPASAFGATLLPDLDSLGKIRGEHAHHSGTVLSVLDPETEYSRIRNIVHELHKFDVWLSAYRRKVR